MWIVAIAWMFVAILMAVAEAVSPIGTVLGAFFTLLLYGIAPVSLVMYILTTPQRKRARRAREAAEDAAARLAGQSALQPDEGRLAAGDAVAAERKEP